MLVVNAGSAWLLAALRSASQFSTLAGCGIAASMRQRVLCCAKTSRTDAAVDAAVEFCYTQSMKKPLTGTCASSVNFDIVDGKLKNVSFDGGCNGNLKAMSALVQDMPVEKAVLLLKGITCGFKPTSCGDQFARALESAL
ncbi:MAG: hypothetical protein Ta2A_15090 [Treponemataceae bacterium]|nr:MAG: hypothetical protein Ta2A_15090 [Treponemataceae bacterium]